MQALLKGGIEDEGTNAVTLNNAVTARLATLAAGSQQTKRFIAESAKKLDGLVDKVYKWMQNSLPAVSTA